MKKVMIITTIGGFLEQFELNDALILKELGWEVHYASNFRYPVYSMNKKKLSDQGIKLHQISIRKLPIHILDQIKALKQLCRLIKEEEITLLHCHNPMGGVLGRLAAYCCRKQEIRVIYTAHGFHFYKGAPIHNWLIYYPIEYLLAGITDCLITINHEDYKRAEAFPMKKERILAYIPGVGIQTNRFAAVPGLRQKIRSKLGIDEDVFYLLSVGELNRNKNHEIVIRAIHKLQNKKIHYGICGSGKHADHLLEVAKQLGVEDQVTLFGFKHNIPQMLQCADCFAFPSKREGLGIAAIEAMAGGIPLITSDCRGTREYMKDSVTGYVCREQSAEAYAEAIGSMIENEDLRKTMGFACTKLAKRFDLSKTDRIMRNVYRRMTAEYIEQ